MKSKLILVCLSILSLNIYAQSGSRKEITSYINTILNQGLNIKFTNIENRSPFNYIRFVSRKDRVILGFYGSDNANDTRGVLYQFNPADILSFEKVSETRSNPMGIIRLNFPSKSVKYSYSWRIKKSQDWFFMLTECVEIPYLSTDELQYDHLVQAFKNLQIDYGNTRKKR